MKAVTRRLMFVAVFFVASVVCVIILRRVLIQEGVRALKFEDESTAIQYLLPLAWFGDRIAQCHIGYGHALGEGGIAKDDSKAVYWLERCGANPPLGLGVGENPAAPHELEVARRYASGGWGVKADPVECAKWLKWAAEGGNKEAQALLAQSFCN